MNVQISVRQGGRLGMLALLALVICAVSSAVAPAALAAAPSLTTMASQSGMAIVDTANLASGSNPTGTITFTAFGPGNPTCTGAPAFTSTVPVSGNGSYPSSPFSPAAPGSYGFVASYSGDANNNPVASPCGAPGESVSFPAPPLPLFTTASVTGPTISDQAIVFGGSNPTGGTVTFTAFGPDNPTCAGAPVFTSTAPVAGFANSGPFTTTTPGSYSFVAVYSGDANNPPRTSPCGAPLETVVVAAPTLVAITTSASTLPVSAIMDSANLAGGSNPTGTITFTAFGPNNPTCTGLPVFTSTVPVLGGGFAASAPFTTTAPGTYNFVAVYSGDANNPSVTSPCGATGESVAVAPPMPVAISTFVSPSLPGSPVNDFANLSGGSNPTGTITFTAFGPNNPTCTGLPVFTSTVPVTAGGFAASASFSPPGPGTYNFVAVYSGDANNPSVTSPCGAPGESVVVAPPTLVAITTSASFFPGNAIMDRANLSGGSNPTGTITFTAFGPNNPTCTGLPVFTSTVPVLGGGFAASAPFTTTARGTYNFVAVYSGDANNPPVTSSCGAPNETVTVAGPPKLAVTKAASPLSLPAPGGAFTFTVRVSNPSASDPITLVRLTDDVYGDLATRAVSTCGALIGVTLAPGASSAPCSFKGQFTGSAGQSQTDTVTASGIDPSGLPAAANAKATVTIVSGQQPPLTATAVACSPTAVRVGQPTTCTATVTGPGNPRGTAKFAGNSSGTFAPAACILQPIAAGQARCSVLYTPRALGSGSHKIYANYSGEAGNAPSHGATTIVVRSGPSLTVVACSPTVVRVGQATTCTATVTGQSHPTGTVAFHTNSSGSFGSPVCTLHLIGGNQARCSVTYTPTAVGTGSHKIYANYSGDARDPASHSSTTIVVDGPRPAGPPPV